MVFSNVFEKKIGFLCEQCDLYKFGMIRYCTVWHAFGIF